MRQSKIFLASQQETPDHARYHFCRYFTCDFTFFHFFSVYLSFHFFCVRRFFVFVSSICHLCYSHLQPIVYHLRHSRRKNMPRRRRAQRVLRVYGGGNIPEIYTWCERSLDKSYNTHLLLFCCVFGTFACFWYS